MSEGDLADGLTGQTFSFVEKSEALLSENVLNLEGLTVGPRLDAGRYAMLGVLDNNGFGSNAIVSFELVIPEPASGALAVIGLLAWGRIPRRASQESNG